MHIQKSTSPKVCVLTQTASAIRPYYRQFFAGMDLHFVTFKEKNPDAVDFLPGSTWSDGRNRLWNHVKGRYDYYLFIDDDLEFFCPPTDLPTSLGWLLQRNQGLLERSPLRHIAARLLRLFSYRPAEPGRFRRMLLRSLKTYRPQVASVALTVDGVTAFHEMDRYAQHRSRRVRPLGWFDAQVTLFSDLGANLLLPYDTEISGWWSSQIPIYVLAHLAFKDRAINILDVASRNTSTSVYRPGYDGIRDCLTMSAWLSSGILTQGCDPIDLADGSFIDQDFGSQAAKVQVSPGRTTAETLEGVLQSLGEAFDLHHAYIYDRHKDLVDALDAKTNGSVAEKVYG